MPAVTLNGTSFAGTVSDADSVRRAPQIVKEKPRKIGVVHEAPDGSRSFMLAGTKSDWELTWKRVPEVTRAAVRAVFDLSTTFSFTDSRGTRTVQCEEQDYTEDPDEEATLPNGTTYYNVTLVVRQP